nr:MAG TPA: Mediator of RNA polymerase II, MEDIATOR COMPLEX, NUCLEUS [Caudoviricetes sp.]DAQ79060.1 MAG TPA: Mediator of RNA polymerase II, MEDIATOR COMPLEX, NUCLEUS [Caudoviricetes sp.]DAV12253.1 MAG TPA: Mediator of RNA polymerase II, MEDIATOR COMPLEX, NUCLEUS [Caudoviricetes sp.]
MDEQERNFIFASISTRFDERKQIQEELKKHKSGVEYVYII